jgi:hypothetical protein
MVKPKFEQVGAEIDWGAFYVRHRNTDEYTRVGQEYFDPEKLAVCNHPRSPQWLRSLGFNGAEGLQRVLVPRTRGVIIVEATAAENLPVNCLSGIDHVINGLRAEVAVFIVIDPNYAHTLRRRPKEGLTKATMKMPFDPDYYNPDGPYEILDRVEMFPNVHPIIADHNELSDALRYSLDEVVGCKIPLVHTKNVSTKSNEY